MAIVNWSREETFKLISLWSEDNIRKDATEIALYFRKLQMVCMKQASLISWNNAGTKSRNSKKNTKESVTKGRLQDRGDISSGNILMQ